MTKLKFIIDPVEEKKYLKYIYDNFDKKTKYKKFTKKQDISLIEKNWKRIGKEFFSFVEKYCKLKWKYEVYYVILSDITNYSFASPLKEHKNKILIDLRNKKIANRIICHELLHHFFAQIYKDNKKFEGIIHELFVTHMLFDTDLNRLFKDKLTIKKIYFVQDTKNLTSFIRNLRKFGMIRQTLRIILKTY